MNVLEKILEEIEEMRNIMESTVAIDCFEKDCKHNDCTVCVCERAMEIIRSRMDDVKNDNWIPCSERLLEEENERYYPMLNVATSYGAVKWGFYRVRDKQWYIYSEIHDEFIEARDKEIVAWQPLPNPYKGE